MLEVSNLHSAYGRIEVLKGVSLEVRTGEVVALIGANPEPLNLPVRYLMIRSIEICSITGRHYIDFPELLELARRGVIDTRHVTTRFFPLESVNDAIDYIAKRGDDEPLWPMYAPDA